MRRGWGLAAATLMGWSSLVGAQPAAEGPSPEALQSVLAGLIRTHPGARAEAARRAGALGHPVFVDPLRARLADPEPSVRAAAAAALGALGVPRTSGDLLAMTRALDAAADDPDDAVAEAALRALARFPFPDVRRRLMERIARGPVARRPMARAAVAGADPRQAQERLTAYFQLTLAETERGLQDRPSPEVRWGVPKGSLVLAARDLLSPEARLHWGAVQILASHPDEDARFPFLVHALTEPDAAPRRLAAGALAKQGDLRAARALESSLSDPDETVRHAALDGVSTRKDAVSAGLLVGRLEAEPALALAQRLQAVLTEQPDAPVLGALRTWPGRHPADVARRGVLVLGARTSTASTELLVDFLARTKHPPIASMAQTYLTERPDGQVVPAALALLPGTEPDSGPRRRLAQLLRGRHHPDVAPRLLDLVALGQADGEILARIQEQPEAEVRPRLLTLADDPDPRVRSIAIQAARGYRGQDALQAAWAALQRKPDDDKAYNWLDAQDKSALLPVRLEILASEAHRRRHATVLVRLQDTRDARIPAPVARATARRPELATEAIPLLLRQPPTPALAALGVLAGSPELPPSTRADAVRAMASLSPRKARPFDAQTLTSSTVEQALLPHAKDDELDVKYAARKALHELAPSTYPSWDPYGRIPLIVEGAAFGAGLMVMATQIAEADLSPWFVGGAGAVLGGATPFLLTLNEDVTLGDAGFFGTYGLWGTGAGYGLALTLDLKRTDRLWFTVAGETLGVAAGSLALQGLDWGLDDVAFANMTALETGLVSAGITALILHNDERRMQSAAGVGMLAGAASLVPLAFLTRQLQVEDDLGLMTTAMAHGAWLGAWMPGIVQPDGMDAADVALGALAGQGAGYLAGLIWAQTADLQAKDAGWSFLGTAIGASSMGGLALMLDGADSRVRFGLIQAGSAAGALSLGLLGRRLEFHENDAWLVGLASVAGAVAGAQLSVRIEEGTFDEPSFPGGMLLGAGLGTAAGLAVSQFVDVSDKTLLRSLLGGAVGGVAGTGLGRMIPDLDVRSRSRITSAVLVTGLALTVPWAENLDLGGRNLAFAGATGATLGSLMALTPYHYRGAGPEAGQVAAGAVFGSGLGVFSGVALAQVLELELAQTGLVTVATIAAAGTGGGLGLVIPDSDPSVPAGLAQGLGIAGFAITAGLFKANILRSSSRTPGRTALMATTFAAHGALHGALLPYTWRSSDSDPQGREVGGGVMLGAGLGVLGSLAAKGLGAPRWRASDLLEASLLTTGMYGIGTGLGLYAEDRRLGAGLVQGLGLVGYVGALTVAPLTEYDSATPFTLTLGIGSGAWLGAWAARLAQEDPSAGQVAGASLAGAGVGMLAGAAWTQLQHGRSEGEVAMDAVAGAATGGGLALLVGASGRESAALVEAGTALGLGLGVALAPSTTFGPGDQLVVALGSTFGAWHGLFLPDILRDSQDVDNRAGGAMLGLGLGYAGGQIAAQFTELSLDEAFEVAVFTTAFEAAGAGLGLAISDLSGSGRAAMLHAAGAVGLVASALVVPHTKYRPDDASLISMTAAFGSWVGGWTPALWEPGSVRSTGGGMLLGLGVGAGVGVLLSQTMELTLSDQGEAMLFGLAGSTFGGGLALMLDEPSARTRSALVSGASVGGLALGIGLAPLTEYTADDRALIGTVSGLGAWHGLWLSTLWGDNDAGSRAGGALVGLGAGWLAGTLAASATELEGSAQLEGGLTWTLGTSLGAGLGLLVPELSDRATVGLMEGLGAAGLLGGLALSDHLTYSSGDVALISAAGLLGAGLGLTLPAFVDQSRVSAQTRAGGVLVGTSAGAISAVVASQFVDLSAGDVIEASSASALGQALGFGLGLMIPDSDERLRFGLMDALGAAGLAAGLVLAPRTAYGEGTLTTLSLSMSMGAGLGTLTPAYWNGSSIGDAPGEQLGGAALLGAGVGLGTGIVLDQAFELTPQTRNHAALGATLGSLTGGGFGLLLSTDDRVAAGLTQGLAALGAGAVGATLKDFDYDGGDLALGSAYVGYLTWHAMGLTLLLDGTDRQAGGVAAGTVGLGALTGMYLAPYIDLTLSDTLMLLAGNVWGSWIGGWGGQLLEDALDADLTGRRQAGLTLISTVLGSDLGLALTGMVVGGLLEVEPTRFAFINLSGLGGMLVGMLGAGFAKGEPLKAGNVIGSLSGLVVGSIVTSFFDWSSSPTWDDLLSKRRPGALGPDKASLGRTHGATGFGVEHWMPSAQVIPDPQGEPMYLFTVSGIFR